MCASEDDGGLQLRLLLASAEAEAEEQADRASVAERRVAALEAELGALRGGGGGGDADGDGTDSNVLSPYPSASAALSASWSAGGAAGSAAMAVGRTLELIGGTSRTALPSRKFGFHTVMQPL